jgi:methyl-accepting chemotaxis protein
MVGEIGGLAGRVAASSQELSASVQQTGVAIGEIARRADEPPPPRSRSSASAQQSSASTQQVASTSDELAGYAAELDRLVASFTV